MERTPSTPYSRAGGLAALGGSMLVAGSMFLPWARAGDGTVNYWGLSDLDAVDADAGTYGLSLALIPLLVLWCALFFAWRTHETRMAWAFGGFTGAMMLYGGDLVAAVGLLLLISGCVTALAANVPEPAPARRDWKGSL
ncbi:hypothetical protein GCM10009830_25520 [Glycomyces endophyticus]|uniref:Uncharacterized protein n=1 Tax=Glycomyces endophyticus TaxID=480996 RepID=A0ABP4SSH2_9ACTN